MPVRGDERRQRVDDRAASPQRRRPASGDRVALPATPPADRGPARAFAAAARNSACERAQLALADRDHRVERRVDQLLGAIAARDVRRADREVAGRVRNDVALELRRRRRRSAEWPRRPRGAANRAARRSARTRTRGRDRLPSMSRAPRIIAAPRSANSRGGFVMFARAAASSAGTWPSLLMMRRMRTGAGSLSIAIRLCTPSVSADAYSIGLRRQFWSVSCSSSQPSITPSEDAPVDALVGRERVRVERAQRVAIALERRDLGARCRRPRSRRAGRRAGECRCRRRSTDGAARSRRGSGRRSARTPATVRGAGSPVARTAQRQERQDGERAASRR